MSPEANGPRLTGEQNKATTHAGSISGGLANTAAGIDQWVGGGEHNAATGSFDSVFGGKGITAGGGYEAIP